MMRHTEEYDLYSCYSTIINFKNKKILDFGGSFGNLIRSSKGKIEPNNYTSIDVDIHALHKGKIDYPDANWIHYSAPNPMYNPNGTETLPQLGKYDVIFSYSVFSHTSYEYFYETANLLKNYIANNGKIYLSFCSQHDPFLVEWFTDKRIRDYGWCDEIKKNDSYVYLVDNQIKETVPFKCNHLVTFYNDNFLKNMGTIHNLGSFQRIVEISTGEQND